VFPQHKNIFKTAQTIIPALVEVQERGFDNLVFIVGEDQKNSFKFLQGKTKAGHPVLPYNSVKIMSRQEVADELNNPDLADEGPRATPMREILKDRDATTEQKFEYWREAMPAALSDEQVMSIMKLAAGRMGVPIEDSINEADLPPTDAQQSAIPGTPKSLRPPVKTSNKSARALRKWMGH
jgi:hypothetical protein